jgi:hypothetical protein
VEAVVHDGRAGTEVQLIRNTGSKIMAKDYVTLQCTAGDNAAWFGDIENYDDNFELFEGMSLAEEFPEDALFRMDDDMPNNLKVCDFLYNGGDHLLVSENVKRFLESEKVGYLEFLQIALLNHRGREVKGSFYVINLLKQIDCIDLEKTQFEWNSLDDEEIEDVENLTIDEKKIPADVKLFRMKYLNPFAIVHRDLADKMRQAGFDYFKTGEIEDIDY